ncbi:MAG TPA: carboxypeptidase regulatory-like domain-containing protein, partial [Chitinophagales bacterium]|nr:carboxypeptidase regulatory-like domain-containing protein [Chitinophagales bacterium]
MNRGILVLTFLLLSAAKIFAQDFYGMVKKADSTGTPIYQANVDILEADKPFKSLKTYFDGSFKFALNKIQTYSVKISYDGYKDTTYTFTTDAKGVPSAQNVNVRLKKDGMRLMGVVKNSNENFPISEATVILKNVMTRKEERQTTGINGRYNFKLEYETNYKVSIDKRSAGIINLYKDTSFYVTTIGFNLPLDYKLDIVLDPTLNPNTTKREGYDPTKAITGNEKPVIEVKPTLAEEKQPFVVEDKKLKSAQDANAKLLAELEKAKKEIDDLKNKETEQKSAGGGGGPVLAKKNKGKNDNNVEVVIIPDNVPAKPTISDSALASIIRQKEAAEKRAEQIEAEIARQKLEEQKRVDEANKATIAAQQKAKEDSILAAQSKQVQDSIANVRIAQAKEKARMDSIAVAKAAQERIANEIASRKAYEDSVNRLITAVQAKAIQDSVARIKTEQEKKAQELALKKAYNDSVSKVVAATRAKFVQDSMAAAKATQERIAKDVAAMKAYEDSVRRVLAAAEEKSAQESAARQKAVAAAREKAKQDSIAAAKAAEARIAKELAAKKAYEDSVSKLIASVK